MPPVSLPSVATVASLGFPLWLRAAHWINALFIGLLMRSGVQILSSFPRLYWGYQSIPGCEWLKLTHKQIPKDRLWITLEQETNAPSWLAQPGGKHLGLGRHWHLASIVFWILNGTVYVVLLFATGEWRRLIPTSWSIFPAAWHTLITYATFHLPPSSASHPYDPLQQLTYAAVVFVLAPFLIMTGAAQSPAVAGRFPWYERLFGGRQTARSLHFLGLLAFVAFTVVHTAMVIYTGLGKNLDSMTLGGRPGEEGLSIVLGVVIVAGILFVYVVTTWISLRSAQSTYALLGALVHPPMRWMARHVKSRQTYERTQVSPEFLVNGAPPESREYLLTQALAFADYHLEVSGLVHRPLCLSYAQLRALPSKEQITLHHCIQGWSSIGAWRGVAFADIVRQCEPLPQAKYAVFWSYSLDTSGRPFYEAVDLATLRHPQTLLAYQLNGDDLSIAHGAPLRLRVETLLGFKMVKWIQRIEFVESYASIREGRGGSREDNKFYEVEASI